ncbi:MAG: type III-B CRISPR module-associated protein Cmr5 [Desulfamplus sp.]|nr:type III-B CRISPR module-associated protein Cmr5 [Desulfamplus sp.]
MNRRIDKFIPKAIEAVKEYIVNDDAINAKYKGAIPSEYNGYIASFCASISRQFNLKAAAAKMSAELSGSEQNKKPLMNAILKVAAGREPNSGETLIKYVLANNQNESEIRDKIMDASIAIKLAIRTFELKKEA